MNVRYPCGPLRYPLTVLLLLFCQLLLSTLTAAQGGTNDSSSGRLAGGAIVVFVRNSSGEPLTTPALVRLYSSDGMPAGQASVSNGGLVSFRNVNPGRYSVEVEASGYAPAHEDATLPIAGEAHVEIYLRPESNAEPIVVSDHGTPLLAPRAKKELDEGQKALIGKDLKQAQKHLDKAGQLAPTHPDVLYLLGILYSQMNDLPKAEKFLLKVAQLEPQQVRAHAALGVVLADERKFDEAVPPLGKALELDAQSWESRWALARCYYHQRKLQSALEQSRQALRDSKGLAPDIALVLAASLASLGQYEESAATLREYIQQHPDRSGALRAQHWLDRLQQAGRIKPN